MGNNRGNRFSDQHTSLRPSSKAYWDFDWEDMGTKDTPANIDYVLNFTGFEKITYIGHSEGTTQIMSGASLIPEYYKAKMNICIFLAPPASMKNNSVLLFELLALPVNRAMVTAMIETIHLYNILPYNFATTGVAVLFCNLFNGSLCDLVLALVMDTDPTIDNTDRYDMYMSNEPSGAGYRNIIHYAQLIDYNVETFKRYDWGKRENQKRYGSDSPPDYNLKALDFPIAMFGGSQDKMADPKDVEWTYNQLKDKVIFYHQYYLGHMSFAIAKSMDYFLVDVMAIVNHYNGMCDESTLNSNYQPGNVECMQKLGVEPFLY